MAGNAWIRRDRRYRLVRRFADIARQEYRAVGIHMALSPQADLATEPRWPRVTGTFGSEPELVSALVGAYVEGFQHGKSGVASDGVAAIVKHWVGLRRAARRLRRAQLLRSASRNFLTSPFAQHVAAFQGAFDANAAGVMPAYPILQGVTLNGHAAGGRWRPGCSKQMLRRSASRQAQHRWAHPFGLGDHARLC